MEEFTDPLELSWEEKHLFAELMPEDLDEILDTGVTRRHFLKLVSVAGSATLAAHLLGVEKVVARALPLPDAVPLSVDAIEDGITVSFRVNGTVKKITVDARATLLDTLREQLQLTGTKKGCDHGQCGACTVIAEGRRVLSCLTLAASCQGRSVTTIEGVATAGALHPVQRAFLDHDGFQCGYCTSGQICSAVALLDEARLGQASYVSTHIRQKTAPFPLTGEEIRERMSGNICRCGAYPNIVAAIRSVYDGKPQQQRWEFAG